MSAGLLKRGLASSTPAAARCKQAIQVLSAGAYSHGVSKITQTFNSLAPSSDCGQHILSCDLSSSSRSCNITCAAAPSSASSSQQAPREHSSNQQQQQQPELPSLLDLLSTHGARLTTAAQMVWAQVLQPGDTVVDATCGNGNDSLFMAQHVGPTGRVYAIDLQASAVEATRHTLQSNLTAEALPELHVVQGCHSQMQQLVGSNVAKLVAFNLGYLPGGDKSIITQAGSTLQAVEAALEVVCPGGLVSIMCYIGHPGGLEEYEQVRDLLAGLPPNYWTSSELKLVNRPTAPILLMLWRRPDMQNIK